MISEWIHGVGHSPVLKVWMQIVVGALTMVSPPACTSSAAMLSSHVDFPTFRLLLDLLWLRGLTTLGNIQSTCELCRSSESDTFLLCCVSLWTGLACLF